MILVGPCLLTACAGTMRNGGSVGVFKGVYQFSEHPSGVSHALSGRLRVMDDSISLIDPTPICTQAQRLQETDSFVFKCGDYGLTAYHQTGGRWRIMYETSRIDQVETTGCAAYEMKAGKRTCTQTVRDHQDRVTPIRGDLWLTPIEVASLSPGSTP